MWSRGEGRHPAREELVKRVGSWLAPLRADPRTLRADAVAAVPSAIAGVPDGMASAVLVGVNPVYGLYASIAGPIGGGLAVSTQLMVVTTTTASALAAGSALRGFPGTERSEALFLLTLLAGAILLAAGIMRLGRYTRFVSVSVLTGFLTGVAVNIILGQLAGLLGSPQGGSPAAVKAWNVVTHPSEISLTAAAVGLSALALMTVLARTRIAVGASLVALVVPTLASLGAGGLTRVSDEGQIPTGIPTPHLPALSLVTTLQLIGGAAAVAVIVLVQGTGVAEAARNPDGSLSDSNRDLIGQGLGNLAAGLFRGQPVGGSLGGTALNIAAGARSRWAAILSGVWILVILVLFAGVVGRIPVATLAAVLIYAAASSLRVARIGTVMRTGLQSRIGFLATLAATLVLPVAAAVGIGVVLSLLLQLNQEAVDLNVVRLAPRDDGSLVECALPGTLPSDDVTVIDVHGSLLFAGPRTLESRLPDPASATRPVVVLRLRGRKRLSATALIVLGDYAARLAAAGGHLFLCGVDRRLADRLERSRRLGPDADVTVVVASATVLRSTLRAHAEAEEWLLRHGADGGERSRSEGDPAEGMPGEPGSA